MISSLELSSLLETNHLLRSPRNAERLLTALDRARQGTTQPQPIESLRREVGLEVSDQGAPELTEPRNQTSSRPRRCWRRRSPARAQSLDGGGPNERVKRSRIACRPAAVRLRLPVAEKGRSGRVGSSSCQLLSIQLNQRSLS